MAQFEIYEKGVVWTNGKVGAILSDCESLWSPFRYFDGGELDIESDKKFNTAAKAFERADEYFC